MTLACLDGRDRSIAGLLHGAPALVVVYTAVRCPIARLYAPGLEALLAPYRRRGVAVLVVGASPGDSAADLRALAERLGWVVPLTRDEGRGLTRALGAERTTDAFVLDAQAVLRYRGAIDDQYGIGYRRATPRARYLLDALEAVLAGREVVVPATSAPGCLLPGT